MKYFKFSLMDLRWKSTLEITDLPGKKSFALLTYNVLVIS